MVNAQTASTDRERQARAPSPPTPPPRVSAAQPGVTPGALQSALLAALPVLVLLVLTPASIYIGNQAHFDHRPFVLFHLALAYALIVLLLFLLFRAVAGLRRAVAYPLALLGAIMLGGSMLAPSPVKELLGGGIHGLVLAPAAVLIDVCLIAVVFALVRFVRTSVLVRATCVFSVLAAALVPSVVAVEAARAPEPVIDWARESRPPPVPIADSPSVYHLVFDGFDAATFGQIVEGLDLGGELAGFVWYEKALTNYTSTRLSFPSFMTGRVFGKTMTDETGGRLGRREGLVKTLSRKGYTVTQYNAYFVNNHTLTHVRRSTALIEEALYGRLRHLTQFLDLSVLLAAPSVLKPLTVSDGRGLASQLLAAENRAVADWTRNPPLLTRMLFDLMLDEEAGRPPRGQYVNGHFLIPHAPHVLSSECEYQPGRTASTLTLVAQSVCAVNKIRQLIGELRRLGRFTDAMVVIHGDHGTIHRDRPLLLFKQPGRAEEPFEIASHVVQLADVVPTIHRLLGLELDGLDGVPLDDASAERNIRVYLAKPLLL